MSSLSVHSSGDTNSIRVARVGNCRRFLNLDAFGMSSVARHLPTLLIAIDCVDTGCCGCRVSAIASAFSILTHSV
jgi:hypothetical protein